MRYAIYFLPKFEDPLTRFGQSWLGRDVTSGQPVEPPGNTLRKDVWRRITDSPRRYGFHATLKAPFRLRAGVLEEDLIREVTTLAASLAAFEAPPLRLSTLGRFLALTLSEPSMPMQALADRVVAELDPLRAPLDEAALARRNPESLDAERRALLLKWGYPHVFGAFTFHMTLTGALDDDTRSLARATLAPLTASFAERPLTVDRLSLFAEPAPGEPFRLRLQTPFGA